MGSQAGYEACRSSWREFANRSQDGSKYFTCHAGLQYVAAPLTDKSGQVGLFLVGQLYWQEPDPREEAERVRRLAAASELSKENLQEAASDIEVIPPEQQEKFESWPFTAARAVNSILHERVGFVERLQKIANLTQIP